MMGLGLFEIIIVAAIGAGMLGAVVAVVVLAVSASKKRSE